MSRRVHELAKEWNRESRDLIAALDKMGLEGRKPSSALTEQEENQLAIQLGLIEEPTVKVGEERIVTAQSGERIVELRVGKNVIRRRPRSTDAAPAEAPPPARPELDLVPPLGGEGPPIADMSDSDLPPLPELIDIPESLTAIPPAVTLDLPPEPAAPPPAEAVPPPPPLAPIATKEPRIVGTKTDKVVVVASPGSSREHRPLQSSQASASAAAARSALPAAKPDDPSRPAGPRILGKIDLKKQEADRVKALTRAAAEVNRGRTRLPGSPGPGAAVTPQQPDMPPDPSKTAGRRKKKRVIEKPDLEFRERESRTNRAPKRQKRGAATKDQRRTEITTPRASKRVVRMAGEVISVGDLARAMGVKAGDVVKKLMEAGMMANINQALDQDSASLMASEFGYTLESTGFDVESALEVGHEGSSTEEARAYRPPVITIMGHVDHGKTSLLDAIRKTNVTAQEAGGITQHIGAYKVAVDNRSVTFLDTPGHEAFTAMRARGAKVTDIVVIVVAADDGVMPQTMEAINHARAAQVPIVVAINKIDKPEANLDRVRKTLAEQDLLPEDWGGQTICVPVSAKTGEGIPQLLELLLLQAELLDLKANPNKPARGAIVEAKLDRGRGAVATVLVQEGTLRMGDPFVCGPTSGRVRAMLDDLGQRVTEAGPSTPVEIIGMSGVPEAGSSFVVVSDDATARQIAEHRIEKQREASLIKTSKVTLEDLYRKIQAGDTKDLRIVLKADVQGSVEALSEALSRLSTETVRTNVLHASVGGITESDVMLAAASDAIVIGFNVRPESKANDAAEREGVEVRLYTVIYDALNEIRDAMEGLLEPTYREKVLGRAEVRQVFSIPGGGNAAGCLVRSGAIRRNATCRLIRDHVVVHQGKVGSLRRFKEDAREVQTGYECGIGLDGYSDIKVGDFIETYEMEEVRTTLLPPPKAGGRQMAAERSY